MDKMVAFCGLSCTNCDAFPANQVKDIKEREKIAEKWTKLFGHGNIIKPEDIYCEGCLSKSGRLYAYCSDCEIRKCGLEKHVNNCASCTEYICEKLNKFISMVPEAKASLEKIRQREKQGG